jgi:hypothetical protein
MQMTGGGLTILGSPELERNGEFSQLKASTATGENEALSGRQALQAPMMSLVCSTETALEYCS